MREQSLNWRLPYVAKVQLIDGKYIQFNCGMASYKLGL